MPAHQTDSTQPRTGHSTALYAFSADPITYGHINIVERISQTFEHCIVAIGRNPAKHYLISLERRRQLAEYALAHLPNVSVTAFEGMVVDFACEQGANVIVKGVRSAADMEYEQVLHQVGVSQEMGIDTHILFADPSLAHVSSSVVKGMQMEHGFIHQYVPPGVKAELEAKLSKQLIIGLTGDIASGKSTLAEVLIQTGKAAGIETHNIDLDSLAHQILAGEKIGEPMYRKLASTLIHYFGSHIAGKNGINREILAQEVFQNEAARLFLNQTMQKPMSILLRRSLKNKQGIVLLNGALLADLDLLALCNYRCILCTVDDSEQKQRLVERGLSEPAIAQRLSAQWGGEAKRHFIEQAIEQAGFGDLWCYESTDKQALKLFQKITEDCQEFTWISNN